MSHFTKVATKLTNQDALVLALNDVGFAGRVEVHDDPVALKGFPLVRQQPRQAHVVVRKRWLSPSYSDLGFQRDNESGTFQMWADTDWLRGNRDIVDRLTPRYAYHATIATMTAQGYSVAEEQQDASGEVRLVLRRYR